MEVPTEAVPKVAELIRNIEGRVSLLEEDKGNELRKERFLALITLAGWAKEFIVGYFA